MEMSKLTFAALFLIASVPLAVGQGTYTQVDYPGAAQTFAQGINAAKDISGYYADANGAYHGFLLSGSTYTTINYPGAQGTFLYGLNDIGQITGSMTTAGIGFWYDVQTHAFTTVNYPNSSQTTPFAINDAGIIVGLMGYDGESLGFELAGSTYSVIAPPGASNVSVGGVSAEGEIVGVVVNDLITISNFKFAHGRYRRIPIPDASGAYVLGTNPRGTALVGYYMPSSGITVGFLYQNKLLTTLQFPGSNETAANSINTNGEIAGSFADASGKWHGFTWTPPAALK
jgi:uncharacterized membrane protein